jgi:hypothetical protein
MLKAWKENDSRLEPILANNQLLSEAESLSRDLADVAVIAAKLLESFESKQPLTDGQKKLFSTVLERAEKQRGAVLLMVVPHLKKLYEAAAK